MIESNPKAGIHRSDLASPLGSVGSKPEIACLSPLKLSQVELPHGPREGEACNFARTPRPNRRASWNHRVSERRMQVGRNSWHCGSTLAIICVPFWLE